ERGYQEKGVSGASRDHGSPVAGPCGSTNNNSAIPGHSRATGGVSAPSASHEPAEGRRRCGATCGPHLLTSRSGDYEKSPASRGVEAECRGRIDRAGAALASAWCTWFSGTRRTAAHNAADDASTID